MNGFSILRGAPLREGLAGPIFLGVVATLIAIGGFSDGSVVGGLLGLGGVGICYAWVGQRKRANAEADEAHRLFLTRAEQALGTALSASPLPAITAPFNLQSGETCHWAGEARWFELRKHTKRVAYSGFVVSVPIVKHVRYRVGTIAPTFQSSEVLAEIDVGRLYVTNKRVFFDGRAKNTTLRFSAIAAVQLFNGGITIEKQTGRSPTLLIPSGAEAAAACIAHGMNAR